METIKGYNIPKETKKLIQWMITDGQRFVAPLLYAPLTDKVVIKAQKIVDSIEH